jgi:uncharacterized protein YecE (DUF72 family)
MAARIYIGTSGWSYKAWGKSFYPKEIPVRDQLGYYATRFPTVEINATFYRLPEQKTISAWQRKAPPGFIFAVKGSQAVTHFKRLKPGSRSFKLLLKRIRVLEDHLGPVLWQLPPNFSKNMERLEGFLSELPQDIRHAIEFRHPSWIDPEIHELLRQYQVANVSVSSLRMPMDLTLTAPFAYARFHGLEGGASHDYTREELRPWGAHLQQCARDGREAFVYFNNDVNTRAPLNAGMLMEMVGASAIHPTSGKEVQTPV